jgi:Ca-activated chloride channel family protein
MERYERQSPSIRTRRLRGALLALTTAGGLLLTGCGAGDTGNASGNSAQDSRGGTAPLPAPDTGRGS